MVEGLSPSALQLKELWLSQEVGVAPEPRGDARAGGGLSPGRGKREKHQQGENLSLHPLSPAAFLRC